MSARPRIALGLGAALTALVLGLQGAGALDGAERPTIDARLAVRGTQAPDPALLVVRIDERTFRALLMRWPFPRSVHARMIDRLAHAGARTIAYDVQFSEPTTPAQDGALLEAVRDAGNVVLATTEIGPGGEPNVFGGGGVLARVRARAGNSNVAPDPGGVDRRLAYAPQGLKAFAIAAAERATGRAVPPSALGGADALIDYPGPPGTVPSVAFSDVLRGRVPDREIRGRIVVVGATAPSLHDVHVTPTAGDDLMAGAELQADAIATALHGFPLQPWPGWVRTLVLLAAGMLVPLLCLRLALGWALLCGLAALAAYLVGAQLAFDGAGGVAPVAAPAIALGVNAVGAVAAFGLGAAEERRRARDAFARFVPADVVTEVLAQAGDGVRLGGIERECTVMFCDIRGFTTYAESRPAVEVMDVLNVFLTEMTEAVLDAGGTLLTFLGDGFMALFGAPLVQPDHADRALAATRVMLTRLEAFNAWAAAGGHGGPFRVGIGLHTGPVVCGNVGSQRRLAYTAIGDTANTASRIEALTKGTPRQVLLSEETRAALLGDPGELVEIGDFDLRGREHEVRVWSLGDTGAPAPLPAAPAAARAS